MFHGKLPIFKYQMVVIGQFVVGFHHVHSHALFYRLCCQVLIPTVCSSRICCLEVASVCRQLFPKASSLKALTEGLPMIRPRVVDICHPMIVRYSVMLQSHPMTAADFRRIALSLEGVEEYSHAGLPAFRVGGRKFASLASQAEGYGNLMLTLEQQAAFVEEAPEIFLPIPGGWGKMGHTHIRLAAASEDVLTGALRTAWKLRIDKNAKTSRKNHGGAQRSNR